MASSTTLAGLAEIGDVLGIDVLDPLPTHWAIMDATSSHAVIVPDTVPRFEYRGESRISDYPLEQGAFASYNKVQEPGDARMLMVCSGAMLAQLIAEVGLDIGRQYATKADFLTTLEAMRKSTDVYDLVTPDATYHGFNLVHYDYKRETRNGATMLLVDAWFREVRVTAGAAYTQSKAVSGADPVSNGGVRTYPYGSNPTVALQGVQ